MLLGLSMNSLFNPSILSALKDPESWSQFWSASSQGGFKCDELVALSQWRRTEAGGTYNDRSGSNLGHCSDVRCMTSLAPKAEVHPRSCHVAGVNRTRAPQQKSYH